MRFRDFVCLVIVTLGAIFLWAHRSDAGQVCVPVQHPIVAGGLYWGSIVSEECRWLPDVVYMPQDNGVWYHNYPTTRVPHPSFTNSWGQR